jgi:HlyD family secretion protein
MRTIALLAACGAMAVFPACRKIAPVTYQGYVEADFVHVGAGIGGRLDRLFVARGQTIAPNAPLFDLDSSQEAASVKHADESLNAAKAQLADLGSGRRAAELDVVRAQLEQATATEQQSASQLARDTAQLEAGGISRAQLESSRAKHEVDAARVRELKGQLTVAELAARPDQIRAQTSQVAAARAAVDEARSRLDEKHVVTAQGGVVIDTLFREGEWVPPGSPVVRLLPAENIKVRFFVPQGSLNLFPIGRAIAVRCDGCASAFEATVSYVATEPEFTPPIIYSAETRAKLVFVLEARPKLDTASALRPGQPVEIVPR